MERSVPSGERRLPRAAWETLQHLDRPAGRGRGQGAGKPLETLLVQSLCSGSSGSGLTVSATTDMADHGECGAVFPGTGQAAPARHELLAGTAGSAGQWRRLRLANRIGDNFARHGTGSPLMASLTQVNADRRDGGQSGSAKGRLRAGRKRRNARGA